MELKLILPIIVLELMLKIIALYDLSKKNAKEVKGEKRIVWVFIILFFSTIGPIFYLVFGHKPYVEKGE